MDIITGDHLEDPQAEDSVMVDMDPPTVEEQSVDQDTIVAHLVLDQVDITMVLALDQDHTGLDQIMGFWQEYWEEDPKQRMMIL